MLFILIICIEILFSGLISNFISPEVLQYIFILLNFIVMIFYLNKYIKDKKLFYIFLFGFFLRIIVLFFDIHVGNVPFSGGDTVAFHGDALTVKSYLPYELITPLYGEYSQFIGIIYFFLGSDSKIFVQFINVLLFMLSAIRIVSIFNNYDVSTKNVRIVFFILMFLMPTAIFESAVLLREMIIVFFITYSISYLLAWMDYKGVYNFFLAVILMLTASLFHSGVQFSLIIYSLVFLVYSPKNQQFKYSFGKILIFIGSIGTLMILTGVISTDFIFSNIEIGQVVAEDTGSAYLTSLDIDTGWELILYAPVQLIYLLFSPMPWMFRGVMDILSFILDSTIYLVFAYSFIVFFKKMKMYAGKIKDRTFVFYILYFSMMIPYSWGTIAAGTAIRHRFKGISILILAVIFFMEVRNDKKTHENSTSN